MRNELTKTSNIWIIGCGNTGKHVSRTLIDNGFRVNATSHSEQSIKKLESLSINAVYADLDDATSLNNLEIDGADIFYFAPPLPQGNEDQRMSAFLGSLKPHTPPRRIVYISTTGVYGNHDGAWITEKTPTNPENGRSKRRLDAENKIIQFCQSNNSEYMILRVAGIYDLNKLPFKRIENGLKVLDPDIAPASNRIHTHDLANICIAAMQSEHTNLTLNVADGNPSSISDYFVKTARLFNLKEPEIISWQQAQTELSPEMMSYLQESKKIDISALITQLKIKLQYPNLSAGLQACKEEYESQ